MRIAASNPDGIGDLILRQPLYQALEQAGHELLLLVRPHNLEVARLVAPRATIVSIPIDPYADPAPQEADALAATWRAVLRFAPELFVVAPHQWTRFEPWLMENLPGVPSLGLNGAPYPASVREASVALPPLRLDQTVTVSVESHDWQKSRALAEAILGPMETWPQPSLQIPEGARDQARRFLEAEDLSEGGYWMVCAGHTTNGGGLRNWHREKWAALLTTAAQRHGLQYAFIGTAPEKAECEAVHALMDGAANGVRMLAGRTPDFAVLAALTALSTGYIGRDTGAMHLAAACGKPVLGVFGGGHWPRFAPVSSRAKALTVEVFCSGCGWICHHTESHCIKAVEVAPVLSALEDLLAGRFNEPLQVLPRSIELARQMEQEAALFARNHAWLARQRYVHLEEFKAASRA